MSLVLSIDLGTSGCRSAVFDRKLNMLHLARAEYPLTVISDQMIEQDADLWWDCVKTAVRDAVRGVGKEAANIKSVAVSSQGITIVPVSKTGQPLHSAISWLDSRAEMEVAELEEAYGAQDVYTKTGKRLSSLYSLPKLLWMKKNLPDLYQKTYKFLLPLDYIQYKMCGNYVTDHTMAAGTMLYGLGDQKWNDSILKKLGIDEKRLSEIAWAGSVAGKVKPEIAQVLGLPDEVLVAVGGQDQKCAAYGAGASARIITVSMGTGSCITKITQKLRFDEKMRLPIFPWIQKDCWDVEGVVSTAGSAFEWFRDAFVPDMDFPELSNAAKTADIGAVDFYPYLSGESSPYWGSGMGMFSGLTLSSGVAECARAVMEGVAYNIRANLDAMDCMEEHVEKIHIFGGGAKSDLWCGIISNVTGKRVVRLESCETALAGAAKLAYNSLGEESGELGEDRVFVPQEDKLRLYDKKYKEYEMKRKQYFG